MIFDQFFHLIKTFSYELYEDPDFVLIIVHEEVVDLVEVVHHMQECELFAETRLGTRVCESLL